MVDRREFLGNGIKLTALLGASNAGAGIARARAMGGLERADSHWPLRNSESFEYQSRAVGDRMAVGIWSHPRSTRIRDDANGPPLDILYVLDGSFALAAAAAVCSLLTADLINPGFPQLLLVGLDYPEGRINARTRDYTMRDSVPAYMDKILGTGTPETTPGGADRFLDFLENELDPLIRSKYNTTDRPAGIVGDSFGGTFTFYAFLRQSKLFDRYWMGSPGIFTTDTDYIAQFEERLMKGVVHPSRIFLSMGSREISGGVSFYEDMGKNFNRILSGLRKNISDDLSWSSKIYEGYTHTSVLMTALNDAIIYLYDEKNK